MWLVVDGKLFFLNRKIGFHGADMCAWGWGWSLVGEAFACVPHECSVSSIPPSQVFPEWYTNLLRPSDPVKAMQELAEDQVATEIGLKVLLESAVEKD